MLTLTNQERIMARIVPSFDALATVVVIPHLQKIDVDIVMVCGPVTTGGLGSKELNLAAIRKAEEELTAQGLTVFNQSMVEDAIERLIELHSPDTYPTELLQEFTLRILESGLIGAMYFLPDWESSTGASWEREQAAILGIDILDFEFAR